MISYKQKQQLIEDDTVQPSSPRGTSWCYNRLLTTISPHNLQLKVELQHPKNNLRRYGRWAHWDSHFVYSTVAVHDDDDDDVDDQEGHLLPLMRGHESHRHPRASSGFKLGWLLIVSFAWHASETLQCLTLSSNFYISCPSIGIFFSFSLVVFVNTTGVTNITHWSSLIIIIIIMDLHQLHEECQNGEFDALQGFLWSVKQKSKSQNSAARFWAESSI